MTTREKIAELCEEAMLLEPAEFDEAILGIATRADGMMVVAYDRTTCIDILARHTPREEAEEWFEFNTSSAWVGGGTPVFVDRRVAE